MQAGEEWEVKRVELFFSFLLLELRFKRDSNKTWLGNSVRLLVRDQPTPRKKNKHNHYFFVIFLVTFGHSGEEVTSDAGERRVDFLSDDPYFASAIKPLGRKDPLSRMMSLTCTKTSIQKQSLEFQTSRRTLNHQTESP